MDTALTLRKKFDQKNSLDDSEIDTLLEQSGIVRKLTKEYQETPLFNIFRALCLAEIPYSSRLAYTDNILSYISDKLVTPEGFTYTGGRYDIVPCYNALLLEACVRLGPAESNGIKNALNWIKRYQVFERGQQTAWQHDGICKYGGCMKAVPCYIGIVKTVRALITYAEFTSHRDREVEDLIDKGTAYMLRHHMYQRLSNQKPISTHITDIMFPQAYMLSVTDLVYIANKRKLWNDQRTAELKALLEEKAAAPGQWNIDYIYSHKGYKAFETRRNPSEWISYIFNET